MIGVGGCWAQSVKDEVFRAVPVRRRRVRARPGPQARRVPDQRLAHRPGLLRVRGLHRPPAGQARARLPGLGADLRRLQLKCSYCIVPSTRGREVVAAAGRARRRGRAAGRRRRARGHAARARTSTPTAATCAAAERTSFAELLRALDAIDGLDRIRYTSPHPKDMREDVDPRARRARRRLRAHPPAAAVRLLADPQGDAPHLRPRALPGPRRADPRARARLRADDRHHRRLPGGDRGRLRGDARGRARRSASTAPSRSSTRRGASTEAAEITDDFVAARGDASSGWSGSSRSSSGARASARSASSAARSTCSSRAPRAPTRRGCAAAPATTRSSTSTGWPQPGEIVPVADHRRDVADAGRRDVAAGARALGPSRRGRRARRRRRQRVLEHPARGTTSTEPQRGHAYSWSAEACGRAELEAVAARATCSAHRRP